MSFSLCVALPLSPLSLSQEGTVVSLHDAGHVRVKVSGIEKWWAPRMLALVREASEASSLKPGDMVKIRALPVAEAEKLQESHGGINDRCEVPPLCLSLSINIVY